MATINYEALIDQLQAGWPAVQSVVYLPRTEADYARLVAILDRLINEVGEDETHPLASLMDIMGVLFAHYEDHHVPHITEV